MCRKQNRSTAATNTTWIKLRSNTLFPKKRKGVQRPYHYEYPKGSTLIQSQLLIYSFYKYFWKKYTCSALCKELGIQQWIKCSHILVWRVLVQTKEMPVTWVWIVLAHFLSSSHDEYVFLCWNQIKSTYWRNLPRKDLSPTYLLFLQHFSTARLT